MSWQIRKHFICLHWKAGVKFKSMFRPFFLFCRTAVPHIFHRKSLIQHLNPDKRSCLHLYYLWWDLWMCYFSATYHLTCSCGRTDTTVLFQLLNYSTIHCTVVRFNTAATHVRTRRIHGQKGRSYWYKVTYKSMHHKSKLCYHNAKLRPLKSR